MCFQNVSDYESSQLHILCSIKQYLSFYHWSRSIFCYAFTQVPLVGYYLFSSLSLSWRTMSCDWQTDSPPFPHLFTRSINCHRYGTFALDNCIPKLAKKNEEKIILWMKFKLFLLSNQIFKRIVHVFSAVYFLWENNKKEKRENLWVFPADLLFFSKSWIKIDVFFGGGAGRE